MPKVVNPVDVSREENEAKKDYFDRHTPHVFCEANAPKGETFKVTVKLGKDYPHPDDYDHFIQYVQLWDREMMLAEASFTAGAMGNAPGHVEVIFTIVPTRKMNLSAMSFCTKHGLWQSESKEVAVTE